MVITNKIKISSSVVILMVLTWTTFYISKIDKQVSIDEIKVAKSSALYSADFSDNKILMGGSHNVFIVKIKDKIGEYTDIGMPQTQYEAEIISNIKGSLGGTITINQQGGYRNGILYIMQSEDIMGPAINTGDYLLMPGKTYLLATRLSSKHDWYILNSHPNARKTISTNTNLSKSELESISRNDPKVQALQEAYKNEILLDADVYHNNTRNSYKSLHPEAETPEVKE